MPRLKPLAKDANPELADAFQTYVKSLGFMPNSVLSEKHLAYRGWNIGKHAG